MAAGIRAGCFVDAGVECGGREIARPVFGRRQGLRDILARSSFHLSGSGSRAPSEGRWALWGLGAKTRFQGDDGALSHDGDVLTGTLGATSYAWNRTVWGLAVSRSEGDGTFGRSTPGSGISRAESSLTNVHPHLRVDVNACFSVWCLLGVGRGDMRLSADGRAELETDVRMSLGALAIRHPPRSPRGLDLFAKNRRVPGAADIGRCTGPVVGGR